jgi:hypothetical protein
LFTLSVTLPAMLPPFQLTSTPKWSLARLLLMGCLARLSLEQTTDCPLEAVGKSRYPELVAAAARRQPAALRALIFAAACIFQEL